MNLRHFITTLYNCKNLFARGIDSTFYQKNWFIARILEMSVSCSFTIIVPGCWNDALQETLRRDKPWLMAINKPKPMPKHTIPLAPITSCADAKLGRWAETWLGDVKWLGPWLATVKATSPRVSAPRTANTKQVLRFKKSFMAATPPNKGSDLEPWNLRKISCRNAELPRNREKYSGKAVCLWYPRLLKGKDRKVCITTLFKFLF